MSTGAPFDDVHAPANGNTAAMSHRLPYNFDNQYTPHPSSHSHAAAHSPATDPFSSILAPSQPPHHAMTVAEWAGIPMETDRPCKDLPESVQQETGDWRDVHRNIKRMDQLYDATFYSWLKSEDNVLVTAMYLHRIANEYSLDRVANALKWLVADWRWESTSILVRHVTVDWLDHTGDLKRAYLLRHLTQNWATQYTATLITAILATPPYVTAENAQRERFLRAFTQDWDFSKLSEFFMYLQSRANIDYKLKCIMLQEAAQHEREALSAKLSRRKKRSNRQDSGNWMGSAEASSSSSSSSDVLLVDHNASSSNSNSNSGSSNNSATSCNTRDSVAMESIPSASTVIGQSSAAVANDTVMSSTDKNVEEPASSNLTWRRHHRRTSSNDAADMNKRYRMTRPDLEAEESESSNAALPSCSASVGCISNAASPSTSTTTTAANSGTSSTSSTSSSTNNRRATTPDHALHHHHHHHHHHLRYPTSSAASPSGTSSSAVGCSNSSSTATSSNSNSGSSGGNNVDAVSAGVPSENVEDSSGVIGGTNNGSTSSASAISSEFSHLHLGSNTVASSSSATSTSNPPVVDVFTAPRHHSCYQTSTSTSSSHLQVHNLRRLRRRSSSSSSSTSTASAASSHQIEDESNVKKRNSERKDSLFCG